MSFRQFNKLEQFVLKSITIVNIVPSYVRMVTHMIGQACTTSVMMVVMGFEEHE